MRKQLILTTALLVALQCSNAFAAAPTNNQDDKLLADYGSKMVEELRKPELATSRCMLSPVIATDGVTVAVTNDRIFSSGDVILAIENETLDANAKKPIRDILMKRGPSDTLQVTLRRGEKQMTVQAKCTDAKPYYDLMLEAAYAASKNDFAECAAKMDAAAKLQKFGSGPYRLAYNCYRKANRFNSLAANTESAYELDRLIIQENSWSADSLSRIRGTILSSVESLQKPAPMLADDLKQQYDQAVQAKSGVATTASAIH